MQLQHLRDLANCRRWRDLSSFSTGFWPNRRYVQIQADKTILSEPPLLLFAALPFPNAASNRPRGIAMACCPTAQWPQQAEVGLVCRAPSHDERVNVCTSHRPGYSDRSCLLGQTIKRSQRASQRLRRYSHRPIRFLKDVFRAETLLTYPPHTPLSHPTETLLSHWMMRACVHRDSNLDTQPWLCVR